jgi:hypothetical protein
MAQRKWSTSQRYKLNSKLSQDEMLTKLKIFNEKFGTDLPPNDADAEIVNFYYSKALTSIEDTSSKNYNILQESLKGLVDDTEDDDEPEELGWCTYFWTCFYNLYIVRMCISQVED